MKYSRAEVEETLSTQAIWRTDFVALGMKIWTNKGECQVDTRAVLFKISQICLFYFLLFVFFFWPKLEFFQFWKI